MKITRLRPEDGNTAYVLQFRIRGLSNRMTLSTYLRCCFQSLELRIHWRNDTMRGVWKMLQCILHKDSRQTVNKEDKILS